MTPSPGGAESPGCWEEFWDNCRRTLDSARRRKRAIAAWAVVLASFAIAPWTLPTLGKPNVMLWWLAGQCAAVVAVFAIPLPRSWAIDRHRAALWLFAAQTPLLLIDVLDSTSVFIVAWLLRIRREEWEQKGKPGRTANVLQACGIGLGLALALALAMSFVVTDFLRRADGGPAGSFFEKNPALTPAAVLLEAGAAAVAGALMWLGHRRAVRTNDGRVLSRVAADLLGLMTAWPLLAVGPYILVFLTCA